MSAASSLTASGLMKASNAAKAVDLIRERDIALRMLAILTKGEIEQVEVRVVLASEGRAREYARLYETEVGEVEPLIRKAIQGRVAKLNTALQAIGVEPGA